MSLIAPTVQGYFTERLVTQRNLSPRTIASYRDTFRLLLSFASQREVRREDVRLDELEPDSAIE